MILFTFSVEVRGGSIVQLYHVLHCTGQSLLGHHSESVGTNRESEKEDALGPWAIPWYFAEIAIFGLLNHCDDTI